MSEQHRTWLIGGTLLLLMATWLAAPLAAQQQSMSTSAAAVSAAPTIATAIRANPGAPKVDGMIDEAAWATAPVISDFTQRDPDEGQPPTERTEVRVIYTDAALYFAVRAFDSEPHRIEAQLTRRDAYSPSDWIGVMIDSYHDRRTAFMFYVNPAGVKRDIYLYNDGGEDSRWDAVWDVATSKDAEGWTAEFRIPFSQLRFAKADANTFGFNVYRRINRKNEELYWKLLPKTESGVASRFGDLQGIEGISPPRRLEILPYTVASQQFNESVANNPFRTGHNSHYAVGGDIMFGLGSNFTLTATVNPDFGQVEADPAVVNLSAFETFFPERRPFFTEGLDIFQFPVGFGGGENLFYSRRIGRAPQGRADSRGGYSEAVNNTTILTAAKVSGKTPSGWTIGLTGALTAEERASVIDSTGVEHRDVVEPRTSYLVARIARDLREGQTRVGVFGTLLNRSLSANVDWLRSSAFTVGLDASHRFGNQTYEIEGWAVTSQVYGSEQAIDITQRSSARYFQRPDNNHTTYDPTRTSLSGFTGRLSFAKISGDWQYSAGFDTRSPGFEINDVGFQRSADEHVQWTWLSRRWTQPGKVFRRFQANINQWSVFNYGWERNNVGGNVNANFTLLNYWGGYFGANRDWNHLSSNTLRGGPMFINPASTNAWAGFFSDNRKKIRGGFNGWLWSQDEGGGNGWGMGFNLSWRPVANMDFTWGPNYNKSYDAYQFLRPATVNDRSEYINGELTQHTISSTFRANVTFTSTLSLELYMQPFVSSGEYLSYNQVTDPRGPTLSDRLRTFDANQVSVDEDGNVLLDVSQDGNTDVDLGNPNFTVLSFRSNAVLRWEYLPGSTIFMVWQHGRSGFDNNTDFSFGQQIGDLFSAPAVNTFVIKVNYWLSP